MELDARMAEHLCTRLCHDLTGPIGAVNNGAEFLAEQGFEMQNEAVELIASSAREAVQRLQFYRQAYGKLNDQGEASLQEKKQLTVAFFNGTKIEVDWPENYTDSCGVPVSQKMSKLILNMIIIASAALIRGGTISVRIESLDETTRQFTITGVGPTVKNDEDVAKILEGDLSVKLDPKSVQAYLTRGLMESMGVTMALSCDDDAISMVATRQDDQSQIEPIAAM